MMVNLTLEEKQLIVDALLFAATPDIVANWPSEYSEKFVALAEKIGARPTKYTYLFDASKNTPLENPELTERIKKILNGE